jgi:hypothetical protein
MSLCLHSDEDILVINENRKTSLFLLNDKEINIPANFVRHLQQVVKVHIE